MPLESKKSQKFIAGREPWIHRPIWIYSTYVYFHLRKPETLSFEVSNAAEFWKNEGMRFRKIYLIRFLYISTKFGAIDMFV